MTPSILEWIKSTREKYLAKPGRVLEVGAFDVNGSPRTLFSDAEEYIGVDQRPGKGVDLVLNAHELNQFTQLFDTIVCCEMLEHDDKPWVTVDGIHNLLKPGGYLIVSSPANGFPEHHCPKDCFRFLPDAYRDFIFRGLDVLELHTTRDPCHCCIGRKPAHDATPFPPG